MRKSLPESEPAGYRAVVVFTLSVGYCHSPDLHSDSTSLPGTGCLILSTSGIIKMQHLFCLNATFKTAPAVENSLIQEY